MPVKRVNVADSVDRISSFPDEVLRHILSFLPTKTAVSTCILSTRWRYLFPFSNNLDFDESLVFNPRGNDLSQDDQTSCFLNFVDRCIMLMNGTLVDKFCLECILDIDPSRVNSWICAAPLRNVRELDLWCTPPRGLWEEPLFVLTCSTLVVLKLGAHFTLNVPASVNLPCLKSLHLRLITFADEISTNRLFSSCPVIEDLIIDRCCMRKIRLLNLPSPSLKRLTLDKQISRSLGFKLVLDAPSLVYLKYTMHVGERYTLLNLYSLSEAHISFGYTRDYSGHMPLSQFLEGISSVQTLLISYERDILRPSDLDVLPLLKNLTCLELRCSSFLKLPLVMKLLRRTPNLEDFFFYGSLVDAEDDECVYVPSCASSRVKAIDYSVHYDESGFEKDMESLEYFLKNGNVLKKMCVRISGIRSDKKLDKKLMMVVEKVKRLGRSKACEITFLHELYHVGELINCLIPLWQKYNIPHTTRWAEL